MSLPTTAQRRVDTMIVLNECDVGVRKWRNDGRSEKADMVNTAAYRSTNQEQEWRYDAGKNRRFEFTVR
jgi:hypothetical protein